MSVEQSFGTMLSMSALPDKPLFVSEWDSCWPNEYRAAAPLFVAGLIAFQGWGGATIHAYRYGNNVEPWLTSRFGRELSINARLAADAGTTTMIPQNLACFITLRL